MTSSVVQEYAILYSDRLFQKDKKWVDGSLKYYEFNKKIEIYNQDGIMVKSDFKNVKWELGNQYTVNKMLVEIVEFEGKTTRDISDAFKKDRDTGKEVKGPKMPVLVKDTPLKEITSKYRSIGTGVGHNHTSGIQTLMNMNRKPVGLKRPSRAGIVKREVPKGERSDITAKGKNVGEALKSTTDQSAKESARKQIQKGTGREIVKKERDIVKKEVSSSLMSSVASSLDRNISAKPLPKVLPEAKHAGPSDSSPVLNFKVVQPLLKRVPPQSTTVYRFIE